MKFRFLLILFVPILLISCDNEILPKPKGFLRLEYPEASYQKIENGCPYSIEISNESMIIFENNCWAKINYPKLNATIHLTFRDITNNLNSALQDVEKLTFEHTIKADAINSQPFENKSKKIYGKLITVEGDVASNRQFYVTDSIKNLLYGTLYFKVKPNYDSILPTINYLEKDIKNIMESVEWKN
ncbi:gliding motility lipoprotein GldD [Urechidicola croceus]|nr:gliding motility lipoprotein GldD [Urechidicola croceus]